MLKWCLHATNSPREQKQCEHKHAGKTLIWEEFWMLVPISKMFLRATYVVITTQQLWPLHGPSAGVSDGFCHDQRFQFSSQQRNDSEKHRWFQSTSYRNRRRQQNLKLKKTVCPSKLESGTSEIWLFFPVPLPVCGPAMSPPQPSDLKVCATPLQIWVSWQWDAQAIFHDLHQVWKQSSLLKRFFSYRENICTFKCSSSVCHPQQNPY